MDNLTADEKLRLSALLMAIDSTDKALTPEIVARAERFFEFLVPKIEEASEES